MHEGSAEETLHWNKYLTWQTHSVTEREMPTTMQKCRYLVIREYCKVAIRKHQFLKDNISSNYKKTKSPLT